MTTQNETIKERMARVRSFRQSNAEVKSVPRVISDEEEFLLQNGGDVRSTENYRDESASGQTTITHTRPGRVLMWKPLENGQYAPRTISESAKGINLQNGWKIKCPQCNTNHEASPYPPGDPNACPARAPLAFRQCPVCGKRILDNMVTSHFEMDPGAPDAGTAIQEDGDRTTPEQRTRVQLDRHLWTFHPRSAEMMGRPPLPTAARQFDGNTRPI